MRRLNPTRLSSLKYHPRPRIRPSVVCGALHSGGRHDSPRSYSTRSLWTFFADDPPDKPATRPRGDSTSTLRFILSNLSSPRRHEPTAELAVEDQLEKDDLTPPDPMDASTSSRNRFDIPSVDRTSDTYRKRLMALPPTYEATYTDLFHLFSHTDQLDQPSLILAARLLIPAMPRIIPERYSTLVGRCLGRMYELNMIVATDPLLLAFVEDIGGIARAKDATTESLCRWYHTVICRLFILRPHKLYDRQVRSQVVLLLQHLLEDLDNYPGSPNTGTEAFAVPSYILDKILHPRLVSASVREMVIAHSESIGVKLIDYHWSLCLASAVKDKNAHAIQRYFEAMQMEETRDDAPNDARFGVEEDIAGEGQLLTEEETAAAEMIPHRGDVDRPIDVARPKPPDRGSTPRSWSDRVQTPYPSDPSTSPSTVPLKADSMQRSPTLHNRDPPASQSSRETYPGTKTSQATTISQRTPLLSPSSTRQSHADHQVPSRSPPLFDRVMHKVRLSLAQQPGDLDNLFERLDPLLPSPRPDSPDYIVDLERHRVAWSTLFHGLAITPRVTEDDLLGLWSSMPDSARSSYAVSPLMQGLIHRQRRDLAWRVWSNHVEFVARTPALLQHIYIDARNLKDAVTACAHLGFEEQIALLDYWASRPKSLEAKSSTFEHSVEIDAFNVNELMISCRKSRSPSVALRLWAAAGPRWGVKLDAASLGILLDTTRFYEGSNHEVGSDETMRTQLKMFFADLSASRLFHSSRDEDLGELGESKFGAYEGDGFSKGGHGVLLDPPGFYWHQTHGTIRPWEIARAIFRQVVLGNWPHLARIVNPLDPNVKWNGDSWYSRYFGDHTRDKDTEIRPVDKLPLPTAKYMHLVPDAQTWSSYIRLLGYFGHVNQIPLALAWMQELGVRPTWVSMIYALAYVKDAQGEPKRVTGRDGRKRFASDEEIVREFLVRWLGEGKESAHSFGYRAPIDHAPRFENMPNGVDENGRRWIVPSPADVLAIRHWFMGSRVRFHHRE